MEIGNRTAEYAVSNFISSHVTRWPELRKRTRNSKDAEQKKINELDRLLNMTEHAQRNLYAAIEQGLHFDEPLQKRAQELKAERQSLLVERILPSDIDAFARTIKAKLSNKDFAKRYLHALGDEITVSGNGVGECGGDAGKLRRADVGDRGKKMGTSEEVPNLVRIWRARSDSNARPLGS